jgi:hypothetical protein
MSETTTTCTVHGPACERIHVGDRVAVVYGPTQVGYGQTGVVVATTRYGNYVVRFDTPATVVIKGETFSYDQLHYGEDELDKVS